MSCHVFYEAFGLIGTKIKDSRYSEGKILSKEGNEKAAMKIKESCLNISEEDWPLEIDRKKTSSLNSEPQLLHSEPQLQENWSVCFSCAASDRIVHSKLTVQKAIERSMMVEQSKVSTAEVFFQKSSNRKSECEVLHIQKVEIRDDKSLTPPKTGDVEQKLLKDGENVFAYDFGEKVVTIHFESSYSKQDI